MVHFTAGVSGFRSGGTSVITQKWGTGKRKIRAFPSSFLKNYFEVINFTTLLSLICEPSHLACFGFARKFDEDDAFADLRYRLVWRLLTRRAPQLTRWLKYHMVALKTGIKGG